MKNEQGDTLIEVLIAVAILAAAIVGGLGIMSYGLGSIMGSIERTQVQANVNSQLSLVQYARDSYIRAEKNPAGSPAAAVWQGIMDRATTSYSPSVCRPDAKPDTDGSRKPFYITDEGTILIEGDGIPAEATTTAYAGHGLWVEAVKSSDTATARSNYIDIYVKACWQPPVGTTNQEARSVMRLYAP